MVLNSYSFYGANFVYKIKIETNVVYIRLCNWDWDAIVKILNYQLIRFAEEFEWALMSILFITFSFFKDIKLLEYYINIQI